MAGQATLALGASLSLGAVVVAGTTVGVVGLGVHAGVVANDLAVQAGRALAVDAYFSRKAGVATGSAVAGVGAEVCTGSAAVGLSCNTRDRALAFDADLAGVAGASTGPTVCSVVLQADANSRTQRLTVLAARCAGSLGADLTRRAGVVALPTVSAVRLEVGAFGAASRLSLNAGHLTHPLNTDRSRLTCVAAGPTVGAVSLQVHTLSCAGFLRFQTGENALAGFANFPFLAGCGFVLGSTPSAMRSTELDVEATSVTFGLTFWATQRALSKGTDFSRLAYSAASATVSAVVVGVHTTTVALGLSSRAFRLHAVAVQTEVLGGAVCGRIFVSEAASAVFVTDLKLSRDLRGFGGTLATAFFASRLGAVRDTFFVFTLFCVGAGFPLLAL